MKKDTSDKTIDLNTLLNSTAQETIITESHQPTEVVTEQTVVRDWDTIIAEWFYRLPKGFAEQPYTESELKVLDEVVGEYDAGGFKPVISEASSTKRRFKKQDVETTNVLLDAKNFVKYLPEEKHSLLVKFIEEIPYESLRTDTINFLNSLPSKDAKKYAASFKTLTNVKKLNGEQYTDYKPLWDLNVEKAMGRGELYIAFRVKGAVTQGSSESYDVAVGTNHYEVKSLDAGNVGNIGAIRPGAEGKASRHPYFTNPLMSLASIIHSMKDKEVQASISELVNSDKLNQLLDIIDNTPTTRPTSGNIITETPGDVPISVMGGLYNAAAALNKIRKSAINKNITSSRITVKSDKTDATYWIAPDDAANIIKSSGKDKAASIKIGTKVTDETKDAKILLSSLLNHPFVKNPDSFTEGLSQIKQSFFGDKAGLVYFLRGVTYVSDDMSEFATTESSQDGYKFDLKAKFKKWTHVQKQV